MSNTNQNNNHKKIKALLLFKLLDIKSFKDTNSNQPPATVQHLGTILANLAHYGFTLSKEALEELKKLSKEELANFWQEVSSLLKELTGADKKMDKYVVYKNFPKEVLEMSQAEYWFNQTLLYLNLATPEIIRQEENPREKNLDIKSLKVLSLAKKTSMSEIYDFLLKSSARWTDQQMEVASFLLEELKIEKINFSEMGFKENAVKLALHAFNLNKINNHQIKLNISTAQDVLRFLAGFSGGDISLKEKTKFKNLPRSLRKEILSILNQCSSLEEDVSRHPEVWKRLFANLHPGDYNFENVKKAYNQLYRNELSTFSSQLEALLKDNKEEALDLAITRPGEFTRRLHQLYEKYGSKSFDYFVKSAQNLKTVQLLKLHKYFETINSRQKLMFAPRGNWTRVQIADNKKVKIEQKDLDFIQKEIAKIISFRLDKQFPDGINLDPKTAQVKLQTNDQKLATYGRGTTFDILPSRQFARSASYWATPEQNYTNIWYDNSWNFFDDKWQALGTCCWNATDFHKAAVFSGDPVNSKTLGNHACQMIDLYFDKLAAQKVKYAVWSVLCYNRVNFNAAESVLATLQTGDNPEKGKLYEPSRADMVFPLTGDNLTKFVAALDVENKQIIYLDANFKADVHTATSNNQILQEKMPAYMEYLQALPSINDLFKFAKTGTTEVLYTDENKKINSSQAYVFLAKNPDNKFTNININELLEDKTPLPKAKNKLKN